MKLRTKIILVVIGLSLFINFIFVVNFLFNSRNVELDRLNKKMSNIGILLNHINAQPLYDTDVQKLEVNLKSFLNNSEIVSISLKELNGNIDMSFKKDGMGEVDLVKKDTKIVYNSEEIGLLTIFYTTSYIDNIMVNFLYQTIASYLLAIIIISLVLYFLLRKLTRPIMDLTEFSKEIAEGNLEKKIVVETDDEIGELSLSLISMRDSIKGMIEKVNKESEERLQAEKEKRELEEQLSQSRKMDAIGQLAGGVAHDFNNMLGGILGAAQLLKSPKRNLDEKSTKFVNMIVQAAERAADLTTKLLTFARKGKIESSVNDINEILDDSFSILTKTIDKKIDIIINMKAKNSLVKGDRADLQNCFINLGINSSHAMDGGGQLICTTENIFLDNNYCDASSFNLVPGDYVKVEMKDTGIGINSNNLDKIFEPFFTTKKLGEGTGLGLAAVYGTVLDHFGAIVVDSKVDIGTKFSLFFPITKDSLEVENITNEIILTGVTGRILLVDDEELMRITGEHILREMGFDVILAKDGEQGVEIFRAEYESIDLVIMDMIMPKKNGSEAFYKMREIDPNIKIVISSGFIKDENIDNLRKDGLFGYIGKPYRDVELSELLRNVLNL